MEEKSEYLLIHWKSSLLPALLKDDLPCASPIVCAIGIGLPPVYYMDMLVREKIGYVGIVEPEHELSTQEIISMSETIRQRPDLIICVVKEPMVQVAILDCLASEPLLPEFPIERCFIRSGDDFGDKVLLAAKNNKTKYQKPRNPIKSVFNSQNKQKKGCFYRKK